jgi:1-carboxybiuret hydrolase subunit AtzG-like protein
MNEPPFDADAVIDALAPLLGIVIGESSRGPVKTHLEIAARYAALLEQADLGDHEEPAPVFTP